MPCNDCNQQTSNPCDPCQETNSSLPCTCPVKDLSTDCSVYTGDTLACSGIATNTVLTEVLQQLDQFICSKFDEVINYFSLINIGTGAKIYRGVTGIGQKEIRTVLSTDTTLLDVVENTETIDITAGTHRLELSGSDLSIIVNTPSNGDRVLTVLDLSTFATDTFLQDAQFNSGNQELTLDMNLVSDHIVDLSFLNNHLESVVYNSTTDQLLFTITDGTVFPIDMAAIVGDLIAGAQIQSDYIESNTSSASHILNRNPSKTVTLGAAGNYNILATDNNYIIEVDNGTNDVTIDITSITATSEFFVGFVQKGTGMVTFVGYDIKPDTLTDVLFGQGHIAAFEIINSTKYLIGTLKL